MLQIQWLLDAKLLKNVILIGNLIPIGCRKIIQCSQLCKTIYIYTYECVKSEIVHSLVLTAYLRVSLSQRAVRVSF